MIKACSFLPAATQMLYDLSLQETLCAVTFECPPCAHQKPKVVRYKYENQTLNSLRINEIFSNPETRADLYWIDEPLLHRCAPDVVLMQDLCEVCQINTAHIHKALRKLPKHPQILTISPNTLSEVEASLQQIGDSFQVSEVAKKQIQTSRTIRHRIAERLLADQTPSLSVCFLEWITPIYNCGHWIPDQIQAAGGKDILSKPAGDSHIVSWESIRAYDPEVLLIAPCGYTHQQAQKDLSHLYQQKGWKQLRAVRTKRVYLIDYELFTQPSLSTLTLGIEVLAACLHPHLFSLPYAAQHKISTPLLRTQSTQSYFKSGIVKGDVIQVLKDHPLDVKFNVIIADPPYNIGKDFGNNSDFMPLPEYIEWTKEWLYQCFRLLEDDGIMYVYGFSEILSRLSSEYPIEQQRWLIWHYTNKAVPSIKFWQRSHESILALWKSEKRPDLEIDQIREPYTQSYLNNSAGKVRKATPSRFGGKWGKETEYKAHKGGALPRDVIKVPALAGGAGANERWFMCMDCNKQIFSPSEMKYHREHETLKHPTQKPMKLTEKLIQSRISKNNTGRVLIPFAGSGSECIVAHQLGCEYKGVEMNPLYIEFANQWMKQYALQINS